MSDNILTEIEGFAELQFSILQVAIITRTKLSAFEDNNSDESIAFLRGRLRAQAEVRRAIFEMSVARDTNAQRQFLAMAKESEIELEEEN